MYIYSNTFLGTYKYSREKFYSYSHLKLIFHPYRKDDGFKPGTELSEQNYFGLNSQELLLYQKHAYLKYFSENLEHSILFLLQLFCMHKLLIPFYKLQKLFNSVQMF